MRRRIVELMLQGHRRKEIAVALDRSIHTVDDHIRAIYDATGIRDRAMLLVAAREVLMAWQQSGMDPA
jgi:DNA-binding NarL/FixJ family response regulator